MFVAYVHYTGSRRHSPAQSRHGLLLFLFVPQMVRAFDEHIDRAEVECRQKGLAPENEREHRSDGQAYGHSLRQVAEPLGGPSAGRGNAQPDPDENQNGCHAEELFHYRALLEEVQASDIGVQAGFDGHQLGEGTQQYALIADNQGGCGIEERVVVNPDRADGDASGE